MTGLEFKFSLTSFIYLHNYKLTFNELKFNFAEKYIHCKSTS